MKEGCPPTVIVNEFRENRSDGSKFLTGLTGKQGYTKGSRLTQKYVHNQSGGLINLTCFLK